MIEQYLSKYKWYLVGVGLTAILWMITQTVMFCIPYLQPKYTVTVNVVKNTNVQRNNDITENEIITEYPDGRRVIEKKKVDHSTENTVTHETTNTATASTPVFAPSPFWNVAYGYRFPDDRHYAGGGVNIGTFRITVMHRVYPMPESLDGMGLVSLAF